VEFKNFVNVMPAQLHCVHGVDSTKDGYT